MPLNNFFAALQSSSLAVLLDGSRFIAMGIQIVHLLALTFLLALVVAFNIRVLRLSLLTLQVDSLARALAKPYLITLIVAVVAGFLLFLPRAETYAHSVPFICKMAFLIAGGTGQFLLIRHLSNLLSSREPSPLFRASSLLTLVLWIATGVAGRAIGFV
jgi:hypothetical protein